MKLEIGDLVRIRRPSPGPFVPQPRVHLRIGFLVDVRDRTVRVMWTDGSESHWLYDELEKIASRKENINV